MKGDWRVFSARPKESGLHPIGRKQLLRAAEIGNMKAGEISDSPAVHTGQIPEGRSSTEILLGCWCNHLHDTRDPDWDSEMGKEWRNQRIFLSLNTPAPSRGWSLSLQQGVASQININRGDGMALNFLSSPNPVKSPPWDTPLFWASIPLTVKWRWQHPP